MAQNWFDTFRTFADIFRDDAPSPAQDPDFVGAGHAQPDMLDLRGNIGAMAWAGRESTALADVNSWANRRARYKEYERLRAAVAEINTMLTVISDEACLAGDTPVTTPFGAIPIAELAQIRKPGERFLVYSWDFARGDYTLAWAHSPRLVKKAPTVEIFLDNGSKLRCTPDHRVLLHSGEWREAGQIRPDDELMPFYRLKPTSGLKTRQFPRVWSKRDGWRHERQMMDEFRAGRPLEKYARANHAARLVAQGLNCRQLPVAMDLNWTTVQVVMAREGFSYKELQRLVKREDRRRVIGVAPQAETDVYDLSVDGHENFATDSLIVHNCQLGENDRIFHIECSDPFVRNEAEWLLHEQLEFEDQAWNEFYDMCLYGDRFWECVIDEDHPQAGIMKVVTLPAETMFRIEDTRMKVMQYQQVLDMTGPDYDVLKRDNGMMTLDGMAREGLPVIQFQPEQVVHVKTGDNRKLFYPYGVSILEAARTPAHMLRLMEDAMLVYRLTRAPERRVFYIDVMQLPGWKATSMIEQIKDQFRKKKVPNARGGFGASAVEDRWHAPSQEEDYWLPVRANGNTRIETLPGAQNLGEIDDALYFRRKLFVSMNFPANYSEQTDPAANKITLSAQDVKFARSIERLQNPFCKGVRQIIARHLFLIGVPPERYRDMRVKMTPPSDWREISRNEVTEARYNRAAAMKGAQLVSDYDILVDILRMPKEKAKDYVSRMKQQKLEDLKLQVMGQNPILLGLGQDDEPSHEVGVDAAGPNAPLPPAPADGTQAPPAADAGAPGGGADQPPQGDGGEQANIPQPDREDIERYDLGIRDYASEAEDEDVDRGELGEV